MLFGTELLPLSGTDLSVTAIIGTVALWVKSLIESWNTRKNTRLAADIAESERRDKSAVDSRLLKLESEHANCQKDRETDRLLHEQAAAERAEEVAEAKTRIEELEALVGLRKKPRAPKSGPNPKLPPAPDPPSFPQRDQTT